MTDSSVRRLPEGGTSYAEARSDVWSWVVETEEQSVLVVQVSEVGEGPCELG